MGTIGERLQSVRKRRGLTQRELADLSGVSVSLVRKLEQGERDDTRLETARRLAVALRVPTSSLITRPDADKATDDAVAQWEPVRRALVGQVQQPDEAPTLTGIESAFARLVPIFRADRYSEILPVLPSLIRDADALGEEARDVRGRILHMTGWFLTHTHQYDAARMALRQALDDTTNRLDAAAIVNNQCWLLIRQGKLDECLRLATDWADRIEPKMSQATNEDLASWGWLLIRVSTAAIRDNRPGEASDAIKLARAAAVRMGREIQPKGDFLRSFGPAMVTLKRAENAIVDDKPDVTLRLSQNVPQAGIKPNSNNWNRHLLDVAEAHVRTKKYGEAFGTLQQARSNAPEWLMEQRYARDVLRKIIDHRRTLTDDMRDLADFVKLSY